jgi:hypothetical protein
LPKEAIANITLWLDAVADEKTRRGRFDQMKIKAEKLVAYCAQNPKMRVMITPRTSSSSSSDRATKAVRSPTGPSRRARARPVGRVGGLSSLCQQQQNPTRLPRFAR